MIPAVVALLAASVATAESTPWVAVEAGARTDLGRHLCGVTGDDRVRVAEGKLVVPEASAEAKRTVAAFIESIGYVPVDLGGTAGCAVMEAPRRPGAVYGEEYRLADARAVAEAVRAGAPIPPTPRY